MLQSLTPPSLTGIYLILYTPFAWKEKKKKRKKEEKKKKREKERVLSSPEDVIKDAAERWDCCPKYCYRRVRGSY
jgi:hypothetical protein